MKKTWIQQKHEEDLTEMQANLTMCEEIISHIEFVYVGDINPPRLRNLYTQGLMWREKAQEELKKGDTLRAKYYSLTAYDLLHGVESDLFPDMPFRSRIL